MPIKLIVNGYYRSGTTFFWDLLKNNFLDDYTVYYEPLNPHIAQYINQEKVEDRAAKLHNKKLWIEYNELDLGTRKKLFLRHPNTNDYGIETTDSLISYLNVFNQEEKNICLQTNRLHFHISEIKNEFGAKNIHLIRHPLDVYNSMVKASILSEKRLKSSIKWIFLGKTQFFGVNKEFNWINRKLGIPDINIGSWKRRFNITLFEKFVIVYTISNYFALMDLDEETDMLLSYEFLMTNSEEALNRISDLLNKEINNNVLMKFNAKNLYNYNQRQENKFTSVIKKFKLVKEWKFIEERLNKDGISYVVIKDKNE